MLLKLLIFLLPVLWRSASCAQSRTNLLIRKYELDVNSSKIMQKDDRKLMQKWADDYQFKRLDISMKYRLQMVKHQEHSLVGNGNVVWVNCLYAHRTETRRTVSLYHDHEHECLKTAASRDVTMRENVEQLEKQIANWRKGYRYLQNKCNDENVGNTRAMHQCLVRYMQNDNFDEVIQRLVLLKLGAMNDLYAYYNSSLRELEECLKTQLSRYLERIRAVLDTLYKCYNIKT
uniref:SFRICE_021337 n=1 Tax=Spodoptera frugiperda TaxID=7108 RepID=A0A2H1W4D7_SPOFR